MARALLAQASASPPSLSFCPPCTDTGNLFFLSGLGQILSSKPDIHHLANPLPGLHLSCSSSASATDPPHKTQTSPAFAATVPFASGRGSTRSLVAETVTAARSIFSKASATRATRFAPSIFRFCPLFTLPTSDKRSQAADWPQGPPGIDSVPPEEPASSSLIASADGQGANELPAAESRSRAATHLSSRPPKPSQTWR
ncbi:uncharacterized protein TrAtP1_001946 [Trichoderma atroviride]|uniref:uncharacterized protein n=1 Tax=Hypocrea atroviridis TaxID=63577 RepID=UPI00331A93AE|nr:hypothetical protein TrAtP1_001946 [Trichoderma atroviride]